MEIKVTLNTTAKNTPKTLFVYHLKNITIIIDVKNLDKAVT